MNIEDLRMYCIGKKGVTEEFPFGEDTLVFKVMGKIFALTGLNDEDQSINLKADPEDAIRQREEFSGDIIPGWHMNKKHWNTVRYNGNLSDPQLKKLVDESYGQVVKGLTKKLQKDLEDLEG